ncbi:hypothetical protein SLNWT_5463 [Streptomyces albus]|uniref:Uncharacterized protein n=1 Tax=Streptomyces albus (strain ATCC 21838 / DSM 41398 / FERM P-419 / JCM 4703 / NBRC 107858) TaxID=1081613 RepID=A0A0B5EVQ0_STRA4|nr:hypothetical protein SLNWT_5463 [Streptomyces albus]
MPEMTHGTPWWRRRQDKMWPVIVRRNACPGFPLNMKFR